MYKIVKANKLDFDEIKSVLCELDLYVDGMNFDNFFIAKDNGKIIAVAKLEDCNDYCLLSFVGVVKKCQNRGSGAQLLNHLLSQADKDIYLYTIIPQFFSKFGFKPANNEDKLPSKSQYDCKNCFPKKCVCMKRMKVII